MHKRSAGVAALLGAVISLLVFTAGAGAVNGGEAIGDDSVSPSFYTPLGMSTGPATVIVQVAGKPVAEVEGDLGRKVSDSEKAQIKSDLRATQAPIAAKVQELGGQVENSFQSAYNGLRVSIGRDKLSTIASMPNVVGIHAVPQYYPDNTNGVPLVLAPQVWDGLKGLHGEGIKIGIIDTGIDYTHADFGGPGTVAAWNDAKLHSTEAANPLLFGPAAPRVKGGTDLVGDDYNAAANPKTHPEQLIPHPDPNPLDCAGHGSHVAGTAAGDGVLADGSTYTGPYNASTISSNSWTVGPGVAPKADLYSIRVFGCEGSTNVVVDAIDWAVDHNMDVINMSLGAPFGTADNPDSVASTNAAKAGIIVVASAGNSGSAQYITGSPAAATGALSVAASDPKPNFPGVRLALSTGQTVVAQNSNAAAVTDGTTLGVRVLRNANNSVSLGCKHPEEPAATGGNGTNEWTNVAGKLVVTVRGTCARVARAVFGQKEGAAAVALVNTSTAYPPFEGTITGNPDNGESYPVSIPFLGMRGVLSNSASDGSKLVAADNGTATLTNVQITNPSYKALADFTSGGVRNGDSALKPEVTAPGVSIVSVGVGTGNGAATLSGTSMAAPHTSGVAALVYQAHPDWKVRDLKAAMVNTADPGGVSNYNTRSGGAGLVQALPAVQTSVDALGPANTSTLSYGFADTRGDYSRSLTLTLRNHGSSAATFSLADSNASGAAHSLSFSSGSVTVPAGGETSVDVTLNVPAASIGDARAYRDVAGLVKMTPTSGNNGVTLRIPYYLVPRADSNVNAQANNQVSSASPTAKVSLSNPGGAIAGSGDFYAWGLSDPSDTSASNDIRAIGVQTFPNPSAADPNRRLLVFAVNTYQRWSSAATDEFDIYVDVDPQNHNGDDYVIAGVDNGAVSTGSFNGLVAASVFSTRSSGASTIFAANAPTDGTTEELLIRTSQLCRTAALPDGSHEPCLSKTSSPRFTYHAYGFDIFGDGVTDAVNGPASFNPWAPSISQGDFVTVAPGGSANATVTIDPSAWATSPQLGEMVVSTDNKAGKDEAALLPLQLR